MSAPLDVIFIWHMHQPLYRDPLMGNYALPWTYLHAVKDYYDMAAIVDEGEGAMVTFNLVPSLLEQILDYAEGGATDTFLLHFMMDPPAMTAENRRFVIDNFFSANRERMIEPNRRYLELLYMAGNGSRADGVDRSRAFSDQDILDLQVWFFLSWTGEAARRHYPALGELARKGRSFTRQDKELLLEIHGRLLRSIIPLYRRLHGQGKAELSVTPYFHPILPLLCDGRIARTAMPRVRLPQRRFLHPEDAHAQIKGGINYFRDVLGITPAGMWPSEGAISDEALSLMARCGIRWAASDEDVLAASLDYGLGHGREALYRAYSFSRDGRRLSLFFRDRGLSDLIGFTYSRWEAERAVEDLTARLTEIGKRHPGGIVSIILDGENAWEYYPDNGYPFLSDLYRAIAANPSFRLTTPSRALEEREDCGTLEHVHPGSWINANYGIWIGHAEENAAWDLLKQARDTATARDPQVEALLASGDGPATAPGEDDTAAAICRYLYAAEGSDWFWWYGDDHFSPHSSCFDRIFRGYLTMVYRLLGMDAPRELYEPIKKVTPAGLVREPSTFITPAINGALDDYFEWLGAGLYDLSKQSSAMHASEGILLCFFYGYDGESFYFRMDGASPLKRVLEDRDRLCLHLLLDREYLLPMTPAATEGELMVKENSRWSGAGVFCQWRFDALCEARVPLKALALEEGETFFVYITLTRDQEETGRWPTHSPLALTYRGRGLELENWLV